MESHCVKLGLIETKAVRKSTSRSVLSAWKSEHIMLEKLQSSAQGYSDTAYCFITATTVQDTTAQELTSVVSGPISSIDPVAPYRGDESTAAVDSKKKSVVSGVSRFSVPHVPVPWGQLTKVIVLNVFIRNLKCALHTFNNHNLHEP